MIVAECQDLLQPANEKDFAYALRDLFQFGRQWKLLDNKSDIANFTATYQRVLGDIPGDLLSKAIDKIIGSWTYGNRMPFPAEVRETISWELSDRRRELSRAEIALRKTEEESHVHKPNVELADKIAELRKNTFKKVEEA